MSEKNPQSNPEHGESKKYFIPMPGETYTVGVVNEDVWSMHASKQKNAPDMTIRMVEVAYETTGPDNEPVIETKMVSDHILADDVQADFMKKHLNTTNMNEGE